MAAIDLHKHRMKSSLLPASPSLVASWGCNSYRVFASGTNPIFMATLDASQFLIRVHFDYQLIVGNERRRLRVGGATAPPTHSHRRSFQR